MALSLKGVKINKTSSICIIYLEQLSSPGCSCSDTHHYVLCMHINMYMYYFEVSLAHKHLSGVTWEKL